MASIRAGLTVASVLMLSGCATPALAQEKPVGNLYVACQSGEETPAFALCQVYIAGFVNGMFADRMMNKRNTPICIPAHTAIKKMLPVILEFMRLRPELSTSDPDGISGMLAAIFLHNYPCLK